MSNYRPPAWELGNKSTIKKKEAAVQVGGL